jgi:hypothetical protein
MSDHKRLVRRIAQRFVSFVLYDLITAITAYCVIALSAMFVFSVLWIRLTQQFAAAGATLGTPFQLGIAWVGAAVTLPAAGVVIYLAIAAYRIPRDVGRTGGRETLDDLRAHFTRRGRAQARPKPR